MIFLFGVKMNRRIKKKRKNRIKGSYKNFRLLKKDIKKNL